MQSLQGAQGAFPSQGMPGDMLGGGGAPGALQGAPLAPGAGAGAGPPGGGFVQMEMPKSLSLSAWQGPEDEAPLHEGSSQGSHYVGRWQNYGGAGNPLPESQGPYLGRGVGVGEEYAYEEKPHVGALGPGGMAVREGSERAQEGGGLGSGEQGDGGGVGGLVGGRGQGSREDGALEGSTGGGLVSELEPPPWPDSGGDIELAMEDISLADLDVSSVPEWGF